MKNKKMKRKKKRKRRSTRRGVAVRKGGGVGGGTEPVIKTLEPRHTARGSGPATNIPAEDQEKGCLGKRRKMKAAAAATGENENVNETSKEKERIGRTLMIVEKKMSGWCRN